MVRYKQINTIKSSTIVHDYITSYLYNQKQIIIILILHDPQLVGNDSFSILIDITRIEK